MIGHRTARAGVIVMVAMVIVSAVIGGKSDIGGATVIVAIPITRITGTIITTDISCATRQQ
jgi:hypothetical protein